MFSSVVIKNVSTVVCTECRAVCDCTALSTHHSLKHFLPQHCWT